MPYHIIEYHAARNMDAFRNYRPYIERLYEEARPHTQFTSREKKEILFTSLRSAAAAVAVGEKFLNIFLGQFEQKK